jgi:hypothetical protein
MDETEVLRDIDADGTEVLRDIDADANKMSARPLELI